MSKVHKIAVVGLGQRGQQLLEEAILPAGKDYNIEVAMVYDSYADRVEKAISCVLEQTGKAPAAAENYQQILDNPEISGIIISTAWEAHIPLAIAAMKAGKYPAMEVGGAYTVEDCWKLVETYEQTGVPCMMLENCCYGKWETMLLNMVRQGVLGEIVHCSGGYHHDLREEVTKGEENRHYRLRNYINRNCENYPTHELVPIGKILDVNNGNRMVTLTATASCAKGLHAYIMEKEGPDSTLADTEFLQGDIVTTVIKCARGQTIVLTLDTTLPRTYSRGFNVRGTKGGCFEDNNMIYIDGETDEYHWDARGLWDNAKDYEKRYLHPLWQGYEPQGGHDGMDFLVFSAYFESLTTGIEPPIDVYDTATYMSITPLSEESILKGSAVVTIPDFTRGKWYMRKQSPDSKYKLNR